MALFDDRTQLEVLNRHDCLKLLRQAQVGRIGLLHQGRIMVVPVNFTLDDHHILFRSDPGAKLDAAIANQDVAFEVDRVDPESRTGWNVLVQGRASVVEDPDALDQLDRSGLHPWARTAKAHWIQVALEDVWGRRALSVFDQDTLTHAGY